MLEFSIIVNIITVFIIIVFVVSIVYNRKGNADDIARQSGVSDQHFCDCGEEATSRCRYCGESLCDECVGGVYEFGNLCNFCECNLDIDELLELEDCEDCE